MLFIDTVTLGDGRRKTNDGYVVFDARVARTGVQLYSGAEVERPDLQSVRVYRPPEEVFSDQARASFAHKPVTIDHPPEPVNAANWSRFAKGYTGDTVQKDGDFLRVPFALMDAAAIAEVDGGKRELSNGYACDLEWTAGTTPAGEAYDAIQRNIRGNHLAIVDVARAGPACRIGDSWGGDQRRPDPDDDRRTEPNKGPSMKTHMIGDNAVEMSDAAIVAVKVLQNDLANLQAANAKLTTDMATKASEHAAALAAKDAELTTAKTASETKDGEIAVLKQKVTDAEMTPQKLDAAVAARVKVIDAARKIAGDKIPVDGKTEAEIRRAAVEARLGDSAKGLSDEAVNGAFVSLASDKTDPIARAVADRRTVDPGDGKVVQLGDATTEYARMRERDANAWKAGA